MKLPWLLQQCAGPYSQTAFSGGMKTVVHSFTTASVPLFSCGVKTSAFRTDKAPIVAMALVYKSISTTGLPHTELLTELSIKHTLGSTGGECPAVCLQSGLGESTENRLWNKVSIEPADKRMPCLRPLFYLPYSGSVLRLGDKVVKQYLKNCGNGSSALCDSGA